MKFVVIFDWKFVLALGASAVGIILAEKLDADAAEQVSTQAVDAGKELASAVISKR